MSVIDTATAPIKDVFNVNDILKLMKDNKKAYDNHDITKLYYDRNQKIHKRNLVKTAFPLATAVIMAGLFTSQEAYDAFQAGVPFMDLMDAPLSDISAMFTSAFDNAPEFMKNIQSAPYETISAYAGYLKDGVKEFGSNLFSDYFNTGYFFTVASVYASAKGILKGFDFASGMAPDMINYRDYDTEKLKLNTLREHFQDPVYDNLNNEEMFAIMFSFNDIVHQNQLGKKKLAAKCLQFVDSNVNILIKPFRKLFNTSTNNKSSLSSNLKTYIEAGFDSENPEKSFEEYGLSGAELKYLAAKDSKGVGKKEIIDYVFDTNKEAMINAYKRKLKDDTLLAFSLKLEKFAKGEVTDYEQLRKEMKSFRTFITGYEQSKTHLGRLELPNELKEMDKVVKAFEQNNETRINNVRNNESYKDYTSFLKKNAPHLITESDNEPSFQLNNYSFITYFEAEKKATINKNYLSKKIKEYDQAIENADADNNVREYERLTTQKGKLKKEKAKYNDIFERTLASQGKIDSLVENVDKKVSSIFQDNSINKKVTVVNILSEKEKEFYEGEGLKEKGISLKNAERAASYRLAAEVRSSGYDEDIKRTDFKLQEKKYRK